MDIDKLIKNLNEATEVDVDKALEVISKLSDIKVSDLKSGKRITVGGFPADLEDNIVDGEINLIAVDPDSAKGIKGLLMKNGIVTNIDKKTNTVVISVPVP